MRRSVLAAIIILAASGVMIAVAVDDLIYFAGGGQAAPPAPSGTGDLPDTSGEPDIPAAGMTAEPDIPAPVAEPAAQPAGRDGTASERPDIAEASNGFALDFYGQVSEGDKNVFFSPISAFLAFSMLYEGARGETAAQLERVFGLDPDADARHGSIRDILGSLDSEGAGAELEIANSVWLADRLEPRAAYADIVRDTYASDLGRVDFASAGAAGEINEWVSERTRGKIPELVAPDAVDELTALVIANAIYFDGEWRTKFPAGDTAPGDFWTGGNSVDADFMRVTSQFRHAHVDGAHALELPYGGGRLVMVVALPHERDGIGALEDSITGGTLEEWRQAMYPDEVDVSLPKFTLETGYDLAGPLRELGLADAFAPASDLSGIADGRLFVSEAVQKAYVSVSEEGTEAAAATGVVVMMESYTPPAHFRADHPFLFFIVDDESGAILFMGRITDPAGGPGGEPAPSGDPGSGAPAEAPATGGEPGPDAPAPAVPGERAGGDGAEHAERPDIAEASNGFAADFYGLVSEGDKNVFFSPLGAFLAFSTLYEGAQGQTAAQLERVFGFDPDADARHASIRGILGSLDSAGPGPELEIANSVWLADRLEPRAAYADIVRGAYASELGRVDFAGGGAGEINEWASEATRGKIPAILDPGTVGSNTLMVAASAIYFDGTWKSKFPPAETAKGQFWTGGEDVDAEFMNVEGQFRHARADNAHILELPYDGGRFSMIVALPHDRDGIDDLEAALTGAEPELWRQEMHAGAVDVYMPKFTLETSYDLAPVLWQLGLMDAFLEDADFGGIADGGLYVYEAVQKAYVDVDEEGTEAAAATAATGELQSYMQPAAFLADHPFLFFITDNDSGTVLFMGRITDPS